MIRSNSGPEFIAFELTEWLTYSGAETYHIEPNKPWQNAYGAHKRLRDGCLSCEEIWNVGEARVMPKNWRCDHDTEHPRSSLGYATPAEFAAAQRPHQAQVSA